MERATVVDVAEKKSLMTYENYRQASDKFDYFILGLSGALCAYVAQGLKPERLGANSYTYELAALGILVFGVILGFRRLEAIVICVKLNHELMLASEGRSTIVKAMEGQGQVRGEHGELIPGQDLPKRLREYGISIKALEPTLDEVRDRAGTLYRWRNGVLLVGFLVLVGARVAGPYQSQNRGPSASGPDRFSVHQSQIPPFWVRVDHTSGETWRYDRIGDKWERISFAPAPATVATLTNSAAKEERIRRILWMPSNWTDEAERIP